MADGTMQHVCAFPISDEQLWEMSAAFIAEGVAADDRVVYFDDDTAESVLERLADDEVPVPEVLERGQLQILPQEATRATLSGSPEAGHELMRTSIDSAIADGFRGWRMTGQLSYALRRVGGVGIVEYDQVIADAIAGRPARALCFYDRRRYPESVQARMRAVHEHEVTAPAVYDDGLLRITRAGVGCARLAGEADHSNHSMLDRLLDSVLDEALRAHTAPTALTVDLASLRFLDVAGAVTLVQAAERFPSTHRLVLRGARPRVHRVLDRCGAPFAQQLDVIARPPTPLPGGLAHGAAPVRVRQRPLGEVVSPGSP